MQAKRSGSWGYCEHVKHGANFNKSCNHSCAESASCVTINVRPLGALGPPAERETYHKYTGRGHSPALYIQHGLPEGKYRTALNILSTCANVSVIECTLFQGEGVCQKYLCLEVICVTYRAGLIE